MIPTYNEAENIASLIERIEVLKNKIPFDLKLLVVDDDSSDGTAEEVKALQRFHDNLFLIQRQAPAGIGSAYMDGFSFSIKNFDPRFLGEIDADLQHPPEVLEDLCKVSQSDKDVVIASRYIEGGGTTSWSLHRRIVSKGANLLTRFLLRLPVKDSTSGYRILSRRAVESLAGYKVSSKGYSFQVESLYVYKKSGMTFAEVPFRFENRRAGKTKLNNKEIWIFLKTAIRTGILGLRKNGSRPSD